MILTSLVDSSTAEILPDYSLTREQQRIEERSRSSTGNLTRYKWGQFRRIELEDTNVSSSTAARINGWWRNGDAVTLTDSIAGSVTSGYIVNGKIPCGAIAAPYSAEYIASLELETY